MPAPRDRSAVPATAKKNSGWPTDLYRRDEGAASLAQRAIDAVSVVCGSAGYFLFALLFVVAGSSYNQWAQVYQYPVFDAPPYVALVGLIGLNALLLTVAVLIRRNRRARLASRRARRHSKTDSRAQARSSPQRGQCASGSPATGERKLGMRVPLKLPM